MPRIPYPSPETFSGPVREAVGDEPPNVTRMLALASEPVYFAYAGLLTILYVSVSMIWEGSQEIIDAARIG